MYITEDDFDYILELVREYDELQRFRFKELMFELLKNNGCMDLKVLLVTFKELVSFQPDYEVINRPMIDEVHRKVQQHAFLNTNEAGQSFWRLH